MKLNSFAARVAWPLAQRHRCAMPARRSRSKILSVADLGEMELIARIARHVGRASAGIANRDIMLGIGDDAALLRARSDEDIAVSTDTAVEGVHFDWRVDDASAVGRRALAAAVSDLAAMGARPLGCTLALAVDPKLELRRLDASLRAFVSEAARRGCTLAGGNLTRASYHFEKSIANIPKFIEDKFNLKNAEGFLSRKKGSANSDDTNLRIAAELVEPHYNLASIYLDQGKLILAEKEYLKTLSIRPHHSSAKIGLGSVYNRKGLYEKAKNFYRQAIKDKQSQSGIDFFPLAHLNLGEVYGKTGKISLAIKEWEQAIKQDPSLLPAHFNLGTAFMMQGKFDLAKKYLLKCLEMNNKHEPTLFNIALVKQKQMDWQDSIKRFNNYMAVTGPRASALTQIGFNYLSLKEWTNAQSFFEKSLSILPTDMNTLILLGDTFLAQGHVRRAEEKYRVALNLNKDSELEKILKNKIKNISK